MSSSLYHFNQLDVTTSAAVNLEIMSRAIKKMSVLKTSPETMNYR